MTSKTEYTECYVWIWLPSQTDPVVAGKLTKANGLILFHYGQSYLERDNAIALYDKELPLKSGVQKVTGYTEQMPGCIRDSAPDAWGRRVILNKLLGQKVNTADTSQLSELTYLMESGSDRIGALDFQQSYKTYQPRLFTNASLAELAESTDRVEKGIPLTAELYQALLHGSSIGGARPKALIEGNGKKHLAKFSSQTDIYNLIKAEFIAMRLAKLCGLNVASVQLERTLEKDVLLIERFDREHNKQGWTRKLMLSALTLLGLDEMTARYASYQDLSEIIRHRFTAVKPTLKELFSRMVFNILCGNTDDHARNHAAFWDGKALTLTPAYDICPQLRTGGEASQAMLIAGKDNTSKLTTCLKSTPDFMLSTTQAKEIIHHQIHTIKTHWADVCDEAKLSKVDRNLFWSQLFLKPYAFEGF